MVKLFEKTWIQSIELRNRSIRSATWSGVGDSRGYVTDRALDFYRTLAEGDIGLIVGGYQPVMTNGVRLPYTIGAFSDDQVEGLGRLAAVAHERGSKMIPQIVHAGSRANVRLFQEGDELWGPSAIPDPVSGRVPIQVTRKQIRTLIEAFAAAAARCKRAGFDGVQLHAGHGYVINQFLSPAWNRRGDAYGGSLTQRCRFLGEVMEAVRGAVGDDFPIFVKLNAHDFVDGGLVPEESVYIARRLDQDGVAAIEVSGGSAASPCNLGPVRKHVRPGGDEAYFADLARFFKELVAAPIMTVGGIRSLNTIENVLANGKADYVAMCRPFIREPHIVRRWKNGDTGSSKCISCNECFETGMRGMGISCKEEKKLWTEQTENATSRESVEAPVSGRVGFVWTGCSKTA
jgi:2,4-dienoyl-CoA reductase-like NADH-dependent reductase (Old Yellow Enzyme family)